MSFRKQGFVNEFLKKHWITNEELEKWYWPEIDYHQIYSNLQKENNVKKILKWKKKKYII